MRTYGRTSQSGGMGGTWTEVTTDAAGYNENVYLTALVQCLRLNRGESPFWSNYGIPALQAVATQVPPDIFVAQTQQQFAQYFSSLTIKRVAQTSPPQYNVRVVCFSGAILEGVIPT